MKRVISLIFFVACITIGNFAQIVTNPVFERMGLEVIHPHIEKVEITKDSTFIYCSMNVEPGAVISVKKSMYIEDIGSHKKFYICDCKGLPFEPEEKLFYYKENKMFVFCFPSIKSIKTFNIIEDSNSDSFFNFYGVDITKNYKNEYTEQNYLRFQNQMDSCLSVNNIIKALEFGEFALDAASYLYGSKSIASSYCYYYLSILYNDYGNNQKAIEYGHIALECDKDNYGVENKDFPVYANTLRSLAGYYADINENEKAIQYYEDAAELFAKLLSVDDDNYSTCKYLQSCIYQKIDSIEKAISIMHEVVDLRKKNLGEKHPYTLMSMNNLASYKNKRGDYIEAIEIGAKIVEIEKAERGESQDYSLWLHNLSSYYSQLSDWDKAISLERESATIQAALHGDHSLEYSNSLNSLAILYSEAGGLGYANDSLAFINCMQALDIKRDVLGDSHYLLASTMSILADLFAHKGDFHNAIKTATEALEIIKKNKGAYCFEYANLLSNVSLYYAQIHEDALAKSTSEEAKNIIRSIYGKKSTTYGEFLAYCAQEYADSGDYLTALNYLEEALIIFKNNITNALNNTKKNWRSIYWNKFSSFFNNDYPYYVYKNNSIKKIGDLYNTRLWCKNILLIPENNMNQDYSWEEIQKTLNENDLAIEFITTYRESEVVDSLVLSLYALTLKKSHAPKMTKILDVFTDVTGHIKQTVLENLFNTLGEIVWGKLCLELEEVNNIYFSPSSLLNIVDIEYQAFDGINNISDKYNVFRVSSTKELLMRTNRKQWMNAVLYGGLDYDNEVTNRGSNEKKEKNRSGFDYLVNTKDEVDSIANILINSNISCELYSGSKGTEESIRKRTNHCIDILHIATHGVYVNNYDANDRFKHNNLTFVEMEKNSAMLYEEKSLTRSFLLLSGGNKLLHRENVISPDKDGILTAKEVSELNFNGVDLVVLSACESGQGEYGFDDSVLGLQRGFKRAGVNTIIMSLRKVDDEPTRILMIEFYKNLLNGKSKIKSLKEAQKYLRKVENGKYEDQKYWASFIMLDGLN